MAAAAVAKNYVFLLSSSCTRSCSGLSNQEMSTPRYLFIGAIYCLLVRSLFIFFAPSLPRSLHWLRLYLSNMALTHIYTRMQLYVCYIVWTVHADVNHDTASRILINAIRGLLVIYTTSSMASLSHPFNFFGSVPAANMYYFMISEAGIHIPNTYV